jgi:hypothetical protein
MTLVVGILCKEGVVMASDGQTTNGNIREPSGPKIHEICFLNQRKALLGCSGVSDGATRVARRVRDAAVSVEFDAEWLLKTTRAAVYEANRDIIAHAGVKGDEKRRQVLSENSFSAMLAFYVPTSPRLFEISSVRGLDEEKFSYAVMGDGGDVAHFILPYLKLSEMTLAEAAVTAVTSWKPPNG